MRTFPPSLRIPVGRGESPTTTNNTIAAVDQNGVVTSYSTAGPATVTATSEGKSGAATISVTAPSTPPNTTGVAVEVYW